MSSGRAQPSRGRQRPACSVVDRGRRSSPPRYHPGNRPSGRVPPLPVRMLSLTSSGTFLESGETFSRNRTRADGMGELSADALPGRVVPGNQTGKLAITLCQAKRQASDPSPYVLAHQANCSLPTITRAFSGAVLPRWRTVEGILQSPPGSPGADRPRLAGSVGAGAQRAPAAPAAPRLRPDRGGAEGPSGHRFPAASPTGLSPRRNPSRASACVCEDCGALIGNVYIRRGAGESNGSSGDQPIRPVEDVAP